MWASTVVVAAAILVARVNSQTVDCSAGPPAEVSPCECCPMNPRFLTPEVISECGLPPKPEAGSRPPPGGKGPRGPSCEAVKCLMNKFNLLTGDKVNRQVFKTWLQQQHEPQWSSVSDMAVQACNTEVDPNTSDCEPKKYFGCIKHNMIKNCPTSIWVQSDDCTKLKPFIQSCPPPGMQG